MNRRCHYLPKKRRFPRFTIITPPSPTQSVVERLTREHAAQQELIEDVRCLVNDFPIYRTHISEYVKLVVLLRKLVSRD